MKHDLLIRATICIYAPEALVSSILQKHLDILLERCPSLDVRLNPAQPMQGLAKIFLGFDCDGHQGMITRKLGTMTSHMYRSRTDGTQTIQPDIIAGINPDLELLASKEPEKVDAVWMTFDPELQFTPGMRQSLDWIESCLITRAWLNDMSTL